MDSPIDPATMGVNALILYDGRHGYGYTGITGNDLHEPIQRALQGTPGLNLVYVESGTPGFVSPVWQWDGWRLRLVNGEGLPVNLDDTLHEAMYFVWEPALPGITPARTVDELRFMLAHLIRSAVPGYYGTGAPLLQRHQGYKDQVFVHITGWKPLPGRGNNPPA
jgi:hypothetical protein